MARKSERLSSSASRAATTHKRAASSTATPSAETKRSRTNKATPTKSQYFDSKDDSDAGGDISDEESESVGGEGSDFDEGAEESGSPEPDDEDDYESEDEPKRRKKSTPGKTSQTSTTIRTKGSDVWKTGVKTGLGPGNQVVIKKPKPRPAGDTPYTDDTLHPNTLLFLSELKENNNREWLKMHDAPFRQAEKDWFSFVEKLTERLIEIDDTVPELPVKDVIFRIYRDVRFSPDPTPYKPHFSAAWSRTGRKGPYAHYYVQVSPNNGSFVGGGLWHPEAAPVAAMRTAIHRHPERIKKVLLDDGVRRSFLKGAPKQDAKVVKAFVASNAENALKTKPKGYEADHVDIDLLRLRNYTIGKTLRNDEVLGAKGLDTVADLFACMKPFITYLNSVVMPDEEEESSAGDGEDEGGEDSNEDA